MQGGGGEVPGAPGLGDAGRAAPGGRDHLPVGGSRRPWREAQVRVPLLSGRCAPDSPFRGEGGLV